MAHQSPLDKQAGPLPEIYPDGDGVSFHLDIVGTRRTKELVIRCDSMGDAWVSIRIPSGSVRVPC